MNKIRLPFRLKVLDENLREIVSPPIWLEFDEPENELGWDWLAKVESKAKQILIEDMQVDVDWEAVPDKPIISSMDKAILIIEP